MNQREFKYDDKDTYTKKELDELLNQHTTFLTNDKATNQKIADLEKKLMEQQNSFKTKTIENTISNLVSKDKLAIVLKMGNFNSTNTDEINAEIKKVFKENPILSKVETPTQHEAPPVKPKTFKYVKPNYNKF